MFFVSLWKFFVANIKQHTSWGRLAQRESVCFVLFFASTGEGSTHRSRIFSSAINSLECLTSSLQNMRDDQETYRSGISCCRKFSHLSKREHSLKKLVLWLMGFNVGLITISTLLWESTTNSATYTIPAITLNPMVE